ncbi:MAG: redoxin domain-containing protein [Gemmatimonadota bacterium]
MDAYRDQYATVFNGGKGVVLLAVSVDSAGELASWASDAKYPFRFLSDPEGRVGRMYGAWNSKYKLDDRSLFVIGPDGKIVARQAPFREIDPAAYRELDAAVDSSAARRARL